MKNKSVDIITLGCSKNLVDSETIMTLFEQNGYKCTHDSESPDGDIVVVNTCGFIEDAKQESIDTILQLAQAKEKGQISRLYVMGCLSQRYLKELQEEIPQVDKWYGKFNFRQLITDINNENSTTCNGVRHITTPNHYAYVKISEGCNRNCAYCAIPIMTGKHISRPMDEILEEVRLLVANGTHEFQVIAQELTYYGIDIDGKQHIAELIDRMAGIEGVEWIRLHYAYPAHFPWELLEVINKHKNVCKYLDIALQHISDNILERMHRHVSKEDTYNLITRIRKEVPGIHLRTTLMVGFPGETEEDFQELIDFVKWARFERMGAFAYSEEDNTFSADNYADDVPAEVKQKRLDKIMRIQQRISSEIEAAKIGTKQKIVVDSKEGDYYICRTEFCSPEVDPEVLVHVNEGNLRIGQFYNVLITDSENFDLYATIVNKKDIYSPTDKENE